MPDAIPPALSTFASWRKSSHSHDNGCVEIADGPDGWVAVRDSKEGDAGGVLRFDAREWAAFVAGVRDGTLTA